MTIKESNGFFSKTINDVSLLKEINSNYQKISIYKHKFFGNIMTLDDVPSISSSHSYRFYESCVQAAICTHPDVKNVLIIGGGNGAMAHELLKHSDIKNIVVVEIDNKIIDISKEYFANTVSSLDDKRVRVATGNGYDFVRDADDKSYDIILIDIADNSFDKIFFAHANRVLKEKGTLITRAKSIDFEFDKYKNSLKIIAEFFRFAIAFKADDVLSLSGSNSLIYASKQYHPTADLLLQKIDMLNGLKYYNADRHNANFALGSDEFKNLLDVIKL